jgi:organic hydroperoxide reductase OsmC/OhrA
MPAYGPSRRFAVTQNFGRFRSAFQSIAAKAKAGCPVSKLIKVEIGFEATLSP